VLLIVNTATAYGFTPQYSGLQDLYIKYKDRGFEILDRYDPPERKDGRDKPQNSLKSSLFTPKKHRSPRTSEGKRLYQ
jgi:glutathione peroxidase